MGSATEHTSAGTNGGSATATIPVQSPATGELITTVPVRDQASPAVDARQRVIGRASARIRRGAGEHPAWRTSPRTTNPVDTRVLKYRYRDSIVLRTPYPQCL